jgi:alpha-1,3-rhamnosyltransferase
MKDFHFYLSRLASYTSIEDTPAMSMANSKKHRVSVCVPSYNHAPFVERCLQSIKRQSAAPSELLVIDDCSKDESVRIIARVLQDCPFPCELIANRKQGLCATLNEALAKTHGDYFAYLGSDDVWLPQFLEERCRLLSQRPNAALGYGHAFLIDERDRIIESSESWTRADYRDGDARPMLSCGTAPVSSTVVYRRSALESHCWNENAGLEDYELYLQLAEDGDFAFDPQVLSAWRIHSYNTSRDPRWLLCEVLEAQERVAAALKWDQARLRRMQRATRFQFTEIFARKGHKAAALSTLLKNLRGAPSLRRIADVALRLAIPQSVLRIRRRKVEERVAQHYGVLQF